MTDIFSELSDWDNVKSGNVPYQRGLTAVVKKAGGMKPDNSQNNFLYFDLYFPEFQAEKQATFVVNNKQGSIRMIKGLLEKLGIDTTDQNSVLASVEATAGWTLLVDHYQSTTDDGKTYDNFRIKAVIDKDGAIPDSDTPFD